GRAATRPYRTAHPDRPAERRRHMTTIAEISSKRTAPGTPLKERVAPTMPLPSFREHPNLKLAISGTFSSGKSTTTEALSIATGIPRTHAKTSRQLLVD